jgi:hypothetical protein
MKSGKQRRAEIVQRRAQRKARQVAKQHAAKKLVRRPTGAVAVNPDALAPNNSYGEPLFVTRGFYTDLPFRCVDCGKDEVWTAHQQKWWYEVAKGPVFATAIRCRPCRRKQQTRKADSRRVHLEGVAKKRTARTSLARTNPR